MIDTTTSPTRVPLRLTMPLDGSACTVRARGARTITGTVEAVAAELALDGYTVVPCELANGRDVRVRVIDGRIVWEAQPRADNYWVQAATLADLMSATGWSMADLRPTSRIDVAPRTPECMQEDHLTTREEEG